MTDRKKDIILEIKNLRLDFGGSKEVLHDVNFVLKRNSITGMAGRSGSGKSLTALTILGLQNSEKCNYSGNILLHINGESIDLLGFSEKEYEKIRGSKISMVFQDIYSSFDPRLKCGVQLIEVLKTHTGKSNKECVLEAKEHFRKFGLNTRIFDSYPHQVSGGELQRVAFAIALASSPDLLIADEPVTNLDAISKKEILDLIKNINDKNNLSILYISHDIASIQYLTDEIVLMDSGETSIVKADKILDKQLNMRFSVKEDIADTKPVLQLKDIRKKYKRNSIFDIFSSSGEFVALKNISFSLNKGEILGIVGESGSGKSTLARIIMGLEKAEKGQYIFGEKDYISANKKDIEYLRKKYSNGLSKSCQFIESSAQ
jgi:peptide/nickel transport system ATP-binding protein